jgi:hypothetical protein
MATRRQLKLVREGEYVAEVEVELIEEGEGWGPYLSLEDAEKLDRVRRALRAGEVKKAAGAGRVYRLMSDQMDLQGDVEIDKKGRE